MAAGHTKAPERQRLCHPCQLIAAPYTNFTRKMLRRAAVAFARQQVGAGFGAAEGFFLLATIQTSMNDPVLISAQAALQEALGGGQGPAPAWRALQQARVSAGRLEMCNLHC